MGLDLRSQVGLWWSRCFYSISRLGVVLAAFPKCTPQKSLEGSSLRGFLFFRGSPLLHSALCFQSSLPPILGRADRLTASTWASSHLKQDFLSRARHYLALESLVYRYTGSQRDRYTGTQTHLCAASQPGFGRACRYTGGSMSRVPAYRDPGHLGKRRRLYRKAEPHMPQVSRYTGTASRVYAPGANC